MIMTFKASGLIPVCWHKGRTLALFYNSTGGKKLSFLTDLGGRIDFCNFEDTETCAVREFCEETWKIFGLVENIPVKNIWEMITQWPTIGSLSDLNYCLFAKASPYISTLVMNIQGEKGEGALRNRRFIWIDVQNLISGQFPIHYRLRIKGFSEFFASICRIMKNLHNANLRDEASDLISFSDLEVIKFKDLREEDENELDLKKWSLQHEKDCNKDTIQGMEKTSHTLTSFPYPKSKQTKILSRFKDQNSRYPGDFEEASAVLTKNEIEQQKFQNFASSQFLKDPVFLGEYLRDHIWGILDRTKSIFLTKSCKGKIPNFKGREKAAELLSTSNMWKEAKIVKVNTSLAQDPIRKLALEDKKTLLVPSPDLEEAFMYKLEASAMEKSILEATTKLGIKKYGIPLSLQDVAKLHVDIFVVGSTVVSPYGLRLGKGKGYGDLEWALMAEIGAVDDTTHVVTTVHDLQVIEDLEKSEVYAYEEIQKEYQDSETKTLESSFVSQVASYNCAAIESEAFKNLMQNHDLSADTIFTPHRIIRTLTRKETVLPKRPQTVDLHYIQTNEDIKNKAVIRDFLALKHSLLKSVC